MIEEEKVHDNPANWVKRHIRKYVRSDGEEGHKWKGAPTLLITTRGRKSGKLRRTALIYGKDGDRYVIVASKGGNPNHPAWYLNLTADPSVEVQLYGEKFTTTASTASSEEKARLWPTMTAVWPPYDEYQESTDRDIPVVILERNTS